MLRTAATRLPLRCVAVPHPPLLPSLPTIASRPFTRSLATATTTTHIAQQKHVDVKPAGLKGLEGNTGQGSEPIHFKEHGSLKDALHTGPDKTGDWVLFHPVYSPGELKAVKVVAHAPKTMSDRVAGFFVKFLRTGFDVATGYKASPDSHMTADQWLRRFLFLESIAGVPGMAAATLRHLRSLRRMHRDNGWLHTLLEEAENERMHLLTFISMKKKAGLFFRLMLIGAQGVFYNLFFTAYILSPKTCHRFVGILEEEAVKTYTHALKELEAGHVPEWNDLAAPDIAKQYWRLPSDAKMVDLLYAVRADEANHRFTNHSLAELDQAKHQNPFALKEPDAIVRGTVAGLSLEESAEWAAKIAKEVKERARLAAEAEKA